MSNPNPASNQSRKRKSATIINDVILSQQQAAMNAAKRSEMIAIQRAKEYAEQVAKVNSNFYSGGRRKRKTYRKRRINQRKTYRR
jgi:hypothetical protein